jgi:signal peptidase II
MTLGQEYKIFGNWAIIHFLENNGMAYGMEFGGEIGKLVLTLFRIIAILCIGYGLIYLIKNRFHSGLIVSVALIFAGAAGNIIDSTFYGVFFSESTYSTPAKLVPLFHGYAGIFHGKVVDMFYFPMLHGVFPRWMPFWAGEEFVFFRPVFNVADAAISIGVGLILIFQKKYYREEEGDQSYLNSEVIEE